MALEFVIHSLSLSNSDMECLKIYYELKLLNKSKKISFLSFLFRFFDPDTSRTYRLIMENFHLKDFEATDYRSAYRQFCDWLYGWKVADATAKGNAFEATHHLAKHARAIDFSNDGERAECERIMGLFETLLQLCKRTLAKRYIDLEYITPRIGQGLKTLSSTNEPSEPAKKPEMTLPKINEAGNDKEEPKEPVETEKRRTQVNRETEKRINMLRGPSADSHKKRTERSDEDVQRDIDDVLVEFNKALDYSILATTIISVIMALAEVSEKQAVFAKYMQQGQDFSSDLITYGLATAWQLFCRDNTSEWTFDEFRNLSNLGNKLDTSFRKSKERKLIELLPGKFEFLHNIMKAFDVHLFPPFVSAHTLGFPAKGLQCSNLDDNIWLSSGYDGTITIHEMKQPWTKYAQYVGHTSIVTDVNFARDDMAIVSSSFDRTIRVWNSSSCVCERTIMGELRSLTILNN
jgi:hypothetical protein